MNNLVITFLSLTIASCYGRPQQPYTGLPQHQPQLQPQLQPQPQQLQQQQHLAQQYQSQYQQGAAHNQPQAHQGGESTPIPIISQTEIVGTDGNFNYSFETGNGIHVEQGGYLKKNPQAQNRALDPNHPQPEESSDIQVIQGSFSYTAPDGQTIVLRYIADERGFQPEGDHLPTAPPAPEGIARALTQHLQQQPQAFGSQQYSEGPTTQYPYTALQ